MSVPEWQPGDRVRFVTFDNPDADLREQSGNLGTVDKAEDPFGYIWVTPDGGGWDPIMCDPYAVDRVAPASSDDVESNDA